METMMHDTDHEETMAPLGDDLVLGVKAISEYTGEPQRRTQYLLETDRLPGFKFAGRWYARKSRLRAHYEKAEAEAAR